MLPSPVAAPVVACIKSFWVSLFPCYSALSFGTVVMVFYSLVPEVIPLVLLIYLIYKRDTLPLLVLFYVLVVMAFTEGILKNIFRQARPIGSCDCSFGMPSSHSAISYGLFSWIILEVIFPLTGWDRQGGPLNWANPKVRRLTFLAVAAVLLLPVPFSRIYFRYHSVAQVSVGALSGIILALAWFGFLRGFVVPKRLLDRLVALKPFRIIRAINSYTPGPIFPAYTAQPAEEEEPKSWEMQPTSEEMTV